MVGMLNDFLMGGYGGLLGQQPGWTPMQAPVPAPMPPAVAKALPPLAAAAAKPTAPGGLMGGIASYLQNNPETIMSLASGLLSGRGTKDALAKGFGAVGPGMAADKKTAMDLARRQALTNLMKNPAFMNAVGPDKQNLINALNADPALAELAGPALIEQLIKIPDPLKAADLVKTIGPDGKPRYETAGTAVKGGSAPYDLPPEDQRLYDAEMADRERRGLPSIPQYDWDLIRRRANLPAPPSEGANALDRAIAPEIKDWVMGGFADAGRQVAELQSAIDILHANPGAVQTAANALPDWARAWVNPDGTTAKDRVLDVAQRSLKAILGAQFTQIEGEKILARAFNQDLSAEENIRRIQSLMQLIQQQSAAKDELVKYWNTHGGTIAGYQGAQPSGAALQAFADIYDRGSKAPTTTTKPAPGTYKVGADGKLTPQ